MATPTGIRPWLRLMLTKRFEEAKKAGDDNLVAQVRDQFDVVEEHQREERPNKRATKGTNQDRRCKKDGEPWPCEAVKKVAVQFSDKPGYKEAWSQKS